MKLKFLFPQSIEKNTKPACSSAPPSPVPILQAAHWGTVTSERAQSFLSAEECLFCVFLSVPTQAGSERREQESPAENTTSSESPVFNLQTLTTPLARRAFEGRGKEIPTCLRVNTGIRPENGRFVKQKGSRTARYG